MLAEVDGRIKSIDAALRSLRLHSIDDYLLSMIFQHLCIRISGNIETGIFDILHNYSKTHANTVVLRAVDRHLASFQNPKCQKIITLLSEFNVDWGKSFSHFAESNDIKDKIDSISANRNQIAHGKPVGISASRIQEFHDAHRKTLEYISSVVV